MLKGILRILVPLLVVSAGIAGAYRYYRLRVERQAARLPAAANRPGETPEEAAARQREQKKRLEETLRSVDETRRMNEMSRPGVPGSATPGADVQRTFQTIEEINRMNRLNRENREKQKGSPSRP